MVAELDFDLFIWGVNIGLCIHEAAESLGVGIRQGLEPFGVGDLCLWVLKPGRTC